MRALVHALHSCCSPDLFLLLRLNSAASLISLHDLHRCDSTHGVLALLRALALRHARHAGCKPFPCGLKLVTGSITPHCEQRFLSPATLPRHFHAACGNLLGQLSVYREIIQRVVLSQHLFDCLI